ncbi:class I SAM-dependent methyltransferase [Streptomyces luteireticuli]|uniref:class I SAM-dependent methyltransferase n=1 Tax=Streptomyces luteireticuli TaxID=173858 RepID=UPI003557B758
MDGQGATPQRPDYGLDAPPVVAASGAVAAVGAACVARGVAVRNAPLAWAGALPLALGGFTAAAMAASSFSGKIRLRDRLLDGLGLRGDESVLDLGCGSGLMLLGALGRLPEGRGTGIDVWRTQDQWGSNRASCLRNARALGVTDRLTLVDGDMAELPFPDRPFDLVTASLAIHNLPEAERRARVIREAARVLRPSGRLLIVDIARTEEYEAEARRAGLVDVRRSGRSALVYPPVRVVTARAPEAETG